MGVFFGGGARERKRERRRDRPTNQHGIEAKAPFIET